MAPRAGLYRFEKRFPERIFDVGIAEQHAVTFAAGMACEGMIPMTTIYSSFLQRGYDQVVHDVALQNLPGERCPQYNTAACPMISHTGVHWQGTWGICQHVSQLWL